VITLAEFQRSGRPSGKAYCIPVGSLDAALAELGDPAGWAKHIELTTARHARDIAAISLYLNAVLAEAIIQARADGAVNGKDVVKAFQDIDKRLAEMAEPARKVAMASTQLPMQQKNQLIRMYNELTTLRLIAKKASVGPGDAKNATDRADWCQKAYDGFRKDCGMNEKFIDMMLTETLLEAGVKIVDR
jgi:hypothetical protein